MSVVLVDTQTATPVIEIFGNPAPLRPDVKAFRAIDIKFTPMFFEIEIGDII